MFYKCSFVIAIMIFAHMICVPSLAVCEGIAEKHGLRPIFDARLILKKTKASSREIALLKREIEPAAAKLWKKRGKDCDEPELEVIDVAHGSFTKPSSTQKAVLYKYCTTGHNFALNGIAILENNHIAAHIMYDGAWDLAIGALPDINGNGLSEILVSTGGTSTGEIWGTVTIIEVAGNSIRKFGHMATYSSNGPRETDENKIVTNVCRLWVKPGPKPVFYRETFREKTNTKHSKWAKTGKSRKAKLDTDKSEYYLTE